MYLMSPEVRALCTMFVPRSASFVMLKLGLVRVLVQRSACCLQWQSRWSATVVRLVPLYAVPVCLRVGCGALLVLTVAAVALGVACAVYLGLL